MKRERNSAVCIALVVLFLFATPLAIGVAWAPGCPCYTVTTNPGTVNTSENVTIIITVSGGTPSSSYQFTVWVTKPGGAAVGRSFISNVIVPTDPSGSGSSGPLYPNGGLGWTTASGSPANTDLPGVYSVSVDKTSPNPAQTGVATTTFLVVTKLNVNIVSPTSGSFVRGQVVTISASVTDNRSQPVTTATVTASTPRSNIPLSSKLPLGTYSSQYPIQINDPVGPWNIVIIATWGSNSGNSSFSAYVASEQLIVSSLSTYNSYGNPTSDFSPGDTLYATFQITYSPSGGFLTTGSFNIQVRDPSGGTTQNLVTVYDPNRALFYTPSGFQVSASDPAGSWQLVVPALSVNDAYANSGPTTTVTYRFQILQAQNQLVISPFYFMIAVLTLGGGLGTAVFLKRFNSTTGPFDDLFKLTGGEIRSPATLMIMSDPGAGSTTMALQLLYRDLAKGKFCGLLSYDAFPSEVGRRMRDMGWDISPYLQSGQMKIIDCYSALAGVEGSLIRDPTDFTEVSIQVTAMIDKAKGPPTILLDSITPIFNAAAAKDCINFLQVLGAKLKNSGGMFIFTATKGSIPEDARSKIEALADSVIELNLTKKAQSLRRSVLVKKISGRQSSPIETGFEIAPGRGILIRKQRIPIGLFRR